MTSLVPGLGNRQLHFLPTLEGKKNTLGAAQDIKFENMNPCNIDFNFLGKKRGQKFHFIGTLMREVVEVERKHHSLFPTLWSDNFPTP